MANQKQDIWPSVKIVIKQWESSHQGVSNKQIKQWVLYYHVFSVLQPMTVIRILFKGDIVKQINCNSFQNVFLKSTNQQILHFIHLHEH